MVSFAARHWSVGPRFGSLIHPHPMTAHPVQRRRMLIDVVISQGASTLRSSMATLTYRNG